MPYALNNSKHIKDAVLPYAVYFLFCYLLQKMIQSEINHIRVNINL